MKNFSEHTHPLSMYSPSFPETSVTVLMSRVALNVVEAKEQV